MSATLDLDGLDGILGRHAPETAPLEVVGPPPRMTRTHPPRAHGPGLLAVATAGGALGLAVALWGGLGQLAPPAPPPEGPVVHARIQVEVASPAPEPPPPPLRFTVGFAFDAVVPADVALPDGLGACTRIEVTGHTDATGPAEVNERVGLARAAAVRDLLVQAGVPADRIALATAGERAPVAPNDTREGRRANRRAEILCAFDPPPGV